MPKTKQPATKETTVVVTQPAGKMPGTRRRKPAVVEIVGQTDDVVLKQVSGFANFLREYGVVALAVGFIAGQQANGVVKQLVESFVDPLAKVWFGQNLSDRIAYLHHNGVPVAVPWGKFVYLLIEFFLVLIVIYLLIKLFKLDRFKKVEEKK